MKNRGDQYHCHNRLNPNQLWPTGTALRIRRLPTSHQRHVAALRATPCRPLHAAHGRCHNPIGAFQLHKCKPKFQGIVPFAK
jgi:hypothetical protein